MNSQSQFSLVEIVKSKRTLTTVLSIIIFAAISWIYFYPDDVMGNVLRQHDIQQGIANGEEARAFEAATGEVTRWTNSLFSGMPTFQIQPSYQSSSMLSWVNKVMGLGFPAPVNLVFIMMVGFFIMMLAFGARWYIAVLGAIGYAFSTYFFILIGAGHIWKYVTLAYIPPTIAGIVWAYRGKYLAGAAVAALFAAVQIQSNHVQMTYYSLFVMVPLVIAFFFEARKKKNLRGWAIATGALSVAAVLAIVANAPNLYNTYKYGKETMRGGHSELTVGTDNSSAGGLDKDYITAWSYGKAETFTLLIPNVNGGATIKPEKGENRFLSLADTDKAQKMLDSGEIDNETMYYLQQFPQYFGDKPMTNGPVYVGALIFMLFLLGAFTVRGPVKWALVIATLISIALAWGRNMMWLTDLMIDYFPLYNKFRTVESILVVAELTIPLLAMLALQQALVENDFFKRNTRQVFTATGLCVLSCIFVWIVPECFGTFSVSEQEQFVQNGLAQQYPQLAMAIESIRASIISSDALRSLIFLLLGIGTLMAFGHGKIKAPVAAAVITVICLTDLWTANKRYLNSDAFTEATPQTAEFTPRSVDLQILADTTQNYRVFDQDHFGDAMPSYFHKCIGGYHAAKLSRYQDLIDHQIKSGNIEVLNMLNTKYVIQGDTAVMLNPEALGNAWFVDTLLYAANANEEMSILSGIHTATTAVADKQFETILGNAAPKAATDTIFETSYAPNRLTYHAQSQNGGLAVFSEVYFPWGWEATIDGNPAELGRVNYVLRAMRIPAGSHTIEMRFNPTTVTNADSAATVAIVLIYLALIGTANLAIYRRIRPRRKQ